MGLRDKIRWPPGTPTTRDPWQIQRQRTKTEASPALLTATGGLGLFTALLSLAMRLPWTWGLVPMGVFCASLVTLAQQPDGEAQVHDAMMWFLFLGGVGLGMSVVAHVILYGV